MVAIDTDEEVEPIQDSEVGTSKAEAIPELSDFRMRLIAACEPYIHPSVLSTCQDHEKLGHHIEADHIAYWMARSTLRRHHGIDDPEAYLRERGVLAPETTPSPENVPDKD